MAAHANVKEKASTAECSKNDNPGDEGNGDGTSGTTSRDRHGGEDTLAIRIRNQSKE
jgi:hypothetical protein